MDIKNKVSVLKYILCYLYILGPNSRTTSKTTTTAATATTTTTPTTTTTAATTTTTTTTNLHTLPLTDSFTIVHFRRPLFRLLIRVKRREVKLESPEEHPSTPPSPSSLVVRAAESENERDRERLSLKGVQEGCLWWRPNLERAVGADRRGTRIDTSPVPNSLIPSSC